MSKCKINNFIVVKIVSHDQCSKYCVFIILSNNFIAVHLFPKLFKPITFNGLFNGYCQHYLDCLFMISLMLNMLYIYNMLHLNFTF